MSGLTIFCTASHFVLEGGVVLMPIQFMDAIGAGMPAAAMSPTVDRKIALPCWGASSSTIIVAAATTLETTTLGAAALITALITLVIIAGVVWLLALLSLLVVRIVVLSLIVGILLLLSMLLLLVSLEALMISAIVGRGIGRSRITIVGIIGCGALIGDLSLK